VLVAQIPRSRVAVIDRAVVLFGTSDDARILLGIEECLAVVGKIVEPLRRRSASASVTGFSQTA